MSEGLRVRMSLAGQLRPVGLIALIGCVYPSGWAAGVIDGWLAVAGVVVFGGFTVFGLVTALRSRRWPAVLVLGADGVEVLGQGTVPWWQVSHLSVTGMQPAWFFVIGRRRYPVVTFVPQPGVELPTLRLPGELRAGRRLAATRRRLYGSQLLVMPRATTATVDDLAAAAHRFGGKETQFRW